MKKNFFFFAQSEITFSCNEVFAYWYLNQWTFRSTRDVEVVNFHAASSASASASASAVVGIQVAIPPTKTEAVNHFYITYIHYSLKPLKTHQSFFSFFKIQKCYTPFY